MPDDRTPLHAVPPDQPRPKVKLDMHAHTEHSRDCRTSLASFARRVADVGIGAICVTDHDTIDGALRLREMNVPFKVVVGEEITSRDGEIVGLFLERPVPPGLTAHETASRIREQGGLVSVPHPFSRNRRRHIRQRALDALVEAKLVDTIEVFNAREISKTSNAHALAYAIAHGLPGAVGSDAHRLSELGRAYVEIADFATAPELLAALSEGTVEGKLSGAVMHLRTWGDLARKLAARAARALSARDAARTR